MHIFPSDIFESSEIITNDTSSIGHKQIILKINIVTCGRKGVFFLDYKRQNNQGMTSGYNMISNHDI